MFDIKKAKEITEEKCETAKSKIKTKMRKLNNVKNDDAEKT